jgi:type I restriction enzyme, S subunit
MINNDIVPEGWVNSRIGEFLEIKYGKGLKESNRKEGKYFVYGSNGIVGKHDAVLTKGATIIIGRKGSIGAVHFSENPCWPIDTTYYSDDFKGISPAYLLYSLKNLTLSELDTSTAIPGLNRQDIYNQIITLAPLEEQKRIVEKVEELIERVNAVKKRLAKASEILKRFRQSVLAAACSGRLTEKWRVTAMGEKAATWQQKEFFELCVLQRGYDLPKSEHKEGPFPIMTSGGIFGHHSEYKAKGPGVLIGRSGSIGKSFYIDENYWPHNTTLFVKDFKGNFPKYVFYFLQGFNFHPFSASTAVPTLNRNNLRGLTISVPHFKEQHEIVDRIETLFNLADFIEERITSAGARAEKLTQAILAKAFRGELVPTEAELARREGRSYEPAFDLLARIKEEYKGEEKRGISRINKNS